MRFSNNVAIVTGGGAGMGRAIAERLAGEGAAVIIGDRDAARGAEVVSLITANGGQAHFVQADITRAADAARLAESAIERYGRLDVLVNNAAVQLHGQDAVAHELDEAIWDMTFAVNIKGAWLCSKYAIPHMLAAGKGAIVNIGSPTGIIGVAPDYTAYSTSKSAMYGLNRAMAAAYAAHNIRVNAVVPGTTATPLIAELLADPARHAALAARAPMGRIGQPEEVAALVAFLASDEARYCTGGVYACDGGMTAV